jgi:hypothetical protein
VTVSPTATIGAGTVTVSNSGGGSANSPFTVDAAPKVTSAAPSVARGTNHLVTITGTGFVSGAQVKIAGTGITTGAVTFVSSTSLTLTVTVASTATAGSHVVTVTNPDSGVGAKSCFTVT